MQDVSTGRTVAFVTMGCAKNEVDSQHMARRLVSAGYRVTEDPEAADVVVVNTCSFIQAATEESIEAVLDAANLQSVSAGKAKLVVAGCMPARYGSDLEPELSEVDAFVPCSQEDDIADIVDRLFGESDKRAAFSDSLPERQGESAVTAYVKISDGCDRFCSYCTIPFIRGRYRSFAYEDIRDEVIGCVARGVREVVLIAQDTGRWGVDFEAPLSLAWLMGRLADEFPQTWFRVMYVQPEGITDELIQVVADKENICSYFDIPFQHCDPDLLAAMNRTGNGEEFLDLVDRIRSRIEGVALRTTLIAGFPGETADQFDALCDFVETAALDYVGVFAYSREDGTRACSLDGQLDEDEKAYRAQQLRDRADATSAACIAQRIGRTVEVLVCGREEDGQLYGRAMCQAPDVDGVTYLDAGEPGQVLRVTVEDTLLYEMEGTVSP